MAHEITTYNAPSAIGPYIQGIIFGSPRNMVMTSGQLPVHPETGEIPEGITAQTRQSLENVLAIIEAGGLSVNHMIKMTVFVKDLNSFALVNEAYCAFFIEHHTGFPARTCVEVARLPKDALIEIEAIAVL